MRRKSVVPWEFQEQIWFVHWLHERGYVCHHSPNGFKRTEAQGQLLKRMGMSKGFPDVFVALKSGIYSSFFVEMKRIKGGKLTKEQAEWLLHLRAQGFYAECAHGCEHAKEMFTHFLSFRDMLSL